jgi:hypothetical protein
LNLASAQKAAQLYQARYSLYLVTQKISGFLLLGLAGKNPPT